jgi:hypothetical protein
MPDVKTLLALLLVGALAMPLYAKGYSSGGGHSYSSGASHSSSAPSASHSSASSSKSYASSSKSSGSASKSHSSYSSGSSNSSSGSRSSSSSPATSYSSGNRSYSSSNNSTSNNSANSTSTKSTAAKPSGGSSASGGLFASSGKSYSSGGSSSNTSFSNPSTSHSPSTGGAAVPSSGGTSGSGAQSNPLKATANVSRKPDGTSSYDSAAARAQAMAESKANFVRSQNPSPAYTDSTGQTRPIDPQDKTVQVLREQLDQDRWVNRDNRTRTFYEPYWSRPVVVYHDSYNSWFWWWLLDRSLDDRAYWAYNHRADMDQQRYRDLLARDSQLENRIRQLEAEGRSVDPTYVPPGIDRDLTYTDEYVNAVYNPRPAESNYGELPLADGHVNAAYTPQSQPQYYASRHHFSFVPVIVVVAFVGFGVWFVFFKRW